MSNKKNKTTKLKEKLTDKFRLVILNEDTFQEIFSLKLSLLNVFVFSGIFSILLIGLTSLLIAFTSLKEYIPGYSSTELNKKATRLVYITDSLKEKTDALNKYLHAIRPVLTGKIKPESIDSIRNSIKKNNFEEIKLDDTKLAATKQDSIFREKIDSKDRFPLINNTLSKAKVVFFSPIEGVISQKFNAKEKHFAIDIVAKKGTPVKAIADGTVILSEWTAETGYVIAIQHANDFVSIYKHNGTLLKEQGDFVKSSEVIASIGSTGELTTGPHLHFELWNNGYPINPQDYIDFQ